MWARKAGQRVEEDTVNNDEAEMLAEAEKRLREGLQKIRNKQEEFSKVSAFQLQRLMTLQRYLVLLLEGKKKMEASRIAAEARWMTTTDHACRCIRAWAKAYLRLGELPEHSQGKHSKRVSLLDDEDIKKRCLAWMRSARPQDRSATNVQQELQNKIFPDKLGIEAKISLPTVVKFLRVWGFSKRAPGQQASTDYYSNASFFILTFLQLRSTMTAMSAKMWWRTGKNGQRRWWACGNSWTPTPVTIWKRWFLPSFKSGITSTSW